ncbi:uncharacterized protein LOC123293798 [Chrysoperla carnea]|uniref:uncharacterized protein LOC123293798 n=1 Tax=Chrysoperla carnea TaxID=189513 RepID=UPI001D07384C|nr:uncharacterized protein LOC123293798 [Chrysoperla carnea]
MMTGFLFFTQTQMISTNVIRKRSALGVGYVSLPSTFAVHELSTHHIKNVIIKPLTSNTSSIIDKNEHHILYATKHAKNAHSIAVVPKKTIEKKIAIITETHHTLIPIVHQLHPHHHHALIPVLPTGGFGVGVTKGGQGAGHGWWVPAF